MPSNTPRYQIPTHLNVADKIDLPLLGITVSLTLRQGVYYLFGWSAAFHFWQSTRNLPAVTAFFCHWLFPVLLALLTFFFATMELRGRYLEQWILVAARFLRQPQVYVWRSTPVSVELSETQQEQEEDE
jgi:hypothetical protein